MTTEWAVTISGNVVPMDAADALERGYTPSDSRNDALARAEDYLDHRMYHLLRGLEEVEQARLHNRRVQTSETLLALIEGAGFEVWNTGGGCLGYRLDLNDGLWEKAGARFALITGVDGATIPDADDTEVLFGTYDADGDEVNPVMVVKVEGLGEAIKTLRN